MKSRYTEKDTMMPSYLQVIKYKRITFKVDKH